MRLDKIERFAAIAGYCGRIAIRFEGLAGHISDRHFIVNYQDQLATPAWHVFERLGEIWLIDHRLSDNASRKVDLESRALVELAVRVNRSAVTAHD